MTQTSDREDAAAPAAADADGGSHRSDSEGHAPDAQNGDEEHEPRYLAVWGGLAALTVAEVWVATLGLPKTTIVVLLVGMALWKAALVALYYMHLKFEPRSVWILATSPLPLAVILVIAVLQEF